MIDIPNALASLDDLANGFGPGATASANSQGMISLVWDNGMASFRLLEDGVVEWVFWASTGGELAVSEHADVFFTKYGFTRYRGFVVKYSQDLPTRPDESVPKVPAALIAFQHIGFVIVSEDNLEWVLEMDINTGRRADYRKWKAGKRKEPAWHKALHN